MPITKKLLFRLCKYVAVDLRDEHRLPYKDRILAVLLPCVLLGVHKSLYKYLTILKKRLDKTGQDCVL